MKSQGLLQAACSTLRLARDVRLAFGLPDLGHTSQDRAYRHIVRVH